MNRSLAIPKDVMERLHKVYPPSWHEDAELAWACDQVVASWQHLLKSTAPCNENIGRHISDLYSFMGLPMPKVFWVDGPFAGFKLTADWPKDTGFVEGFFRWFGCKPKKLSESGVFDSCQKLHNECNGILQCLGDELGKTFFIPITYTQVKEHGKIFSAGDADTGKRNRETFKQYVTSKQAFVFQGGSLEGWVWSYFESMLRVRNDMNYFVWMPLIEIAKESFCFWLANDKFALCRRPKEIYLESTTFTVPINSSSAQPPKDGILKLHNPDNAALSFRDGFKVYAYDGIAVSEKVIKREYSPEDIFSEKNSEVRRIMMELYGGIKKALMDLNAEQYLVDRHPDPKWGSLYSIPANTELCDRLHEAFDDERGTGEHFSFVICANPTPNPDGTDKIYVLRVAPGYKKSQEAVLSTWRFKFKEDFEFAERA